MTDIIRSLKGIIAADKHMSSKCHDGESHDSIALRTAMKDDDLLIYYIISIRAWKSSRVRATPHARAMASR